ncbi:hypothetical protein [Kineococcus auxinigenes]|uniref:hypothetical protein n=1 Tax=unclassified Kineococcus TaxID=2621656 RepID=UPI003D7C7E22
MESTGSTPNPAEARAALADIEDAQRAVRDTPWPTWIYPVNALLLGGMALTFLVEENRTTLFLAVAFTIVGVNMTTGYRMGTPWTVPTSRGFIAAVAAAGACVLAALLASELTERAWPVVAFAAAATAAYLVAGVVHRRSTGRPQ